MNNVSQVNTYTKIPLKIEAIQFKNNIDCINEMKAFAGKNISIKFSDDTTIVEIKTLEGILTMSENDYLIKGIKGEFYPCREDIFLKTYKKI